MIKYLLFLISLSIYAQDFENITFIKGAEKEEDNFKLLNALSSSLMYGYWINNSINSNGTRTLLNPKTSEPLPYQGVRTLSLIDLYLTHSLIGMTSKESTKIHTLFFATIMEKEQVAKYSPYTDKYASKYTPIVNTLVPFTKKLNLKKFEENDIITTNQGSNFSDDFSAKIASKLNEKLKIIWKKVRYYSESGNIPLEFLSDALLPLNYVGEVHLDSKGANYYQFDILLPGLIDFKKVNPRGMPSSNPLEWQIRPGLSRNLNPPLQGLAESIEKMSYLKDASEGTQWEKLENNLIHLNIYKDLKEVDKLELTMEFGEIPMKIQKKEKIENRLSLFPLDVSSREAALKVSGKLSLKKGENINKVLHPFILEAWIHRLSFDFIRTGRPKTWKDRFDANSTFKMVYKEDKSILSMRITKGTDKPFEVFSLKMMGFTCVQSEYIYKELRIIPLPDFKFTCLVDLSNSKDFKSIFIPKIGPRVARKTIGAASIMELSYILKDLNQLNTVDFSEDTKLFSKIFSIFKDNQLVLEALNMLPPELTNFDKK